MNIAARTHRRSRISYEALSPASQKTAISNLLNSNYYAEVVCDLVEYDIKSRLVADYPVDLVDIKVAQIPSKLTPVFTRLRCLLRLVSAIRL